MAESIKKPIILITGAAGNIGSALTRALAADYHVIGLDRESGNLQCEVIPLDLASEASVTLALDTLGERHGRDIAAVIHLAAYFDFTGEENPLYKKVNEDGTRMLLQKLQAFNVERFIYASTMLVHQPTKPGQAISEDTPLAPKWAYPKSKARTEQIIKDEHGHIPYLILRLAGLYDETSGVPTLTRQIARIYERSPKAHLYAGDKDAGQAFVHQDDIIAAFKKAVEHRADLPEHSAILIGEEEAVSYQELQDLIARDIHGTKDWGTISLPETIAKTGAWLQEKTEPLVPDDFDYGEKPFIRPFMIDMASDHYALDIRRARKLLGWEPQHSIRQTLPSIIEALKHDPLHWYKANKITPPDWLQATVGKTNEPEALRQGYEESYRKTHQDFLWAHFLNIIAGIWLIFTPFVLAYQSQALFWSDIVSGILVITLSLCSLSWRFGPGRWLTALVGIWLLSAPLIFWAPTAQAYLNDTMLGTIVICLSVLSRPTPGMAPAAALTGPTKPPGWSFNPSSWFQRLPIIALAVVGFFISRYMAAYQLGHIDSVWEPFFMGGPDPKNGTEEIITSSVSEAWPVPDAGLGALTYMLEILTGIVGSSLRWRTMPWLVILFGVMIVPLGVVSIFFIIIQPIMLGTWCTLCLIAAAAMLIQIPYSFDELVATGQFLYRRNKQGRPLLRIFFTGDTDEGNPEPDDDDFEQDGWEIIKDAAAGGVGLPWNLAICMTIGLWLMFTRISLDATGGMADADHLIGSLVITITVIALAEVARPVRFLNIPLGLCLLITPFIYDADLLATVASIVSGLAIAGLSIRRGTIRNCYGDWNRFLT